MRIGIEGQRLFRKKKHGMDMVALELVRNLQQIDTTNEYFIFIKPDEDDKVITPTANFTIVPLDGGFYPRWEQVALPHAAKAYQCDLLHCTSNTAPIQGNIPLIITLHDIIYMESSYLKILRGSGTPYQKFGNVYRRMIVPRVIRKSRKIITVSHFEKNRIGEFFGMGNDSRLTAVYNGVSEHFKHVTDTVELARVKKKYSLPDKYFFFLGNTDPKKNTKGTLKAYSDFVRQTGENIKLVMLDYDQTELDKLLEEIGDKELINNILLTGYVVNTDLPSIYSQCELFLYPSLRESFGIPMLEAMRCGVPVITSNTSSMPEVSGDAAMIIDPYKPDEITTAMKKILNSSDLRQNMIDKGYQQSLRFSWKRMAEEVLSIYHSVYSDNQRKK
jgi:glycosyltransferase involved in cell wall biosynthesis